MVESRMTLLLSRFLVPQSPICTNFQRYGLPSRSDFSSFTLLLLTLSYLFLFWNVVKLSLAEPHILVAWSISIQPYA